MNDSNELRDRWDLQDQRSANNSEDIPRLSGPISYPTGEVISLWRLKIQYVENHWQPWCVATHTGQVYPRIGEASIIFDGDEKEAKDIYYSEDMWEKYPGGQQGQRQRIAQHGGPGRGQGRKPLNGTAMKTKPIDLPLDLIDRMQAEATDRGVSFAQVVRDRLKKSYE